MNIVKLLDKIKVEDDFFNQNLKGRYAYHVRCEYIIPLESITLEEYNRLEKEGVSEDVMYYSTSTLLDFIDFEETERINNINKYIYLNKFVSDDDITIDELKRFRTWLAENVLNLSSELDDKTLHMLHYYVNEMNDDVCKYLQMFEISDIQFTSASSGCGCNKTSGYTSVSTIIAQTTPAKHICGCEDNSSLYNLGDVNLCDPLAVYRKNIYAKMVEVFSNIEFWLQFDKDFISEFKKYIDNIVQANFTLTTSEYISIYADCNCLSEKDLEQKKNIDILNNLSKSLEFISNEDVVGHKNFINDALLSWSSMLYEKMRW